MSVELLAIRRVDDDRRVAHVRVDAISINIWIVAFKSGSPRISWPESGKGYPIVEADEPLKSQIDKLILDAVTPPPARSNKKRDRPSTDRPFHDDPLDDLFRLAAR